MDIGIRAAAAMVYGINVRGLRFQPTESCRPPYGVFEYPIPIEAAGIVEEHLKTTDPAVLREVRHALATPTTDALLGQLRTIFTGIGLTHGQYYSHPGMIDACARALATDLLAWPRLEEQRIWAEAQRTHAPTDPLIEILSKRMRGRPEPPLPELFVMSDPAWQGSGDPVPEEF